MIRVAELMRLAMKEVNFHIGFVEVMSARYRALHEVALATPGRSRALGTRLPGLTGIGERVSS